MSSLRTLADTLYLEEVARARAMDAGEKLLEGPRLFERAWRIMADGMRHRHPVLGEREILALVEADLARLAAIERS